MLRNIPRILPPDLVRDMMNMGHSDYLVIADANFPGTANSKRLIRMDGIMIPPLLEAIMEVFPLDTFVSDPVKLMQHLPQEPIPGIWETYRDIISKADKDGAFKDFVLVDRLPFYQIAQKAYVVIQTGDEVRYGNIILQKGCC